MKELFSPNEGRRVVREGRWLLMKCSSYQVRAGLRGVVVTDDLSTDELMLTCL